MIIGIRFDDKNKVEVSKTYRRLVTDLKGVRHVVTFQVLREATYDEWKAQNPRDSGKDKSKDSFYLISMD